MRYFLSLVFLLFCTISVFAQPVNDECSGLIDLGVVPFCPDTEFFTNVDATESSIGVDNFPIGCDNGDIAFVGRDVWFQFTTDAMLVDYTITCTGITDGAGSIPMSNPQVMIYRGDCSFDNLSLVKCGRSLDGNSELAVDVIGLDPNTPYFIRINDWSATATPNSGTFQLCIGGLDPVYIMGEDLMASTCAGTLYDSGGENGDYSDNENNVFTLCPNEFHECILIDVASFNMENNLDVLNVYEGDNTNGLLIASLTGGSGTNPFEIETSGNCVTFQFISDGSVVQEGFELTWECTVAPCTGSSVNNPTVIPNIPYDGNNLSTCGEAATVAESPCNNATFLNGPDYVFTYDSPGDICVAIIISGADNNTGVLVLDGPPGDPGTLCVSSSPGGVIGSANMQAPGIYYIIVANAAGCTDFNIDIEEADCTLSPALVDALCNPLNGCQEVDSTGAVLPSILFFEDGFQDVEIIPGTNAGCWFGVGTEPDFYWFTIEAQTTGPFGFILESADNPSDIDFNVWGPFTEQQVCDSAAFIINIIETSEPIRSSYAGGPEPTGLTDFHPATGVPVEDVYDCDGPGVNDDVVSTIAATEGEHYVVLVNDWGNQIAGGGISIDWGPSGPGVLDPDLQNVPGADTTLCAGESVQIQLPNWISTIQWLDNTNTLSCDDCTDPIATPLVSTIYQAIVTGICLNDTIDINVFVYELNAGPDFSICFGEEVPLSPNVIFDDVDYIWTGDNLSCTNCAEPVVSTNTPGTYTYVVEQIAPNCSLFDTLELTVLTTPAPTFDIIENTAICLFDPIELGAPGNDPALTYTWTSNPPGLNSTLPNPTAFPVENTTFYVTVMSNLCAVPTMDSVFIEVDLMPVVDLANDTLVCQGEVVSLGNTVPQAGVTYSWSPDTDLNDPDIANPILTANAPGNFILTAVNGACTLIDTVEVMTSVISIDIENDPDSITICKGEEVTLTTIAEPNGIAIIWTTDNGSFTDTSDQVTVAPEIITTYYATVNIPGCTRVDTFLIDVDSLPYNLDIMPADTSVCPLEPVILSTQAYQQADFPEIDFLWTPTAGQQSPDSLLNMVIATEDSTWYYRTTTNGVCFHLDSAFVAIQTIPEIFATPEQSMICAGESVQLLATSPEITDFTWTPDDGTISCTDCPDPTVTPTGNAVYTVEGAIGGCPVQTSVSVQVTLPPTLSLVPDQGICLNDNININLNPMQAQANTTYSWTSDPTGFSSTDVDPTVAPTVSTIYFVTADNGACPPVTAQVIIEVLGVGTVDAGEDITVCQEDNEFVELAATSSSTNGTYGWSSGSSASTAAVPIDVVGEFVYYVTFDNNCGPVVEDSVIVTVVENITIVPPFIYTPDENPFNEGDEVTIMANTDPANPANLTYQWTFADQPVASNSNSIDVTFIKDDTRITLLVSTIDGCESYHEESREVIEAGFDIPNAFTPDADGHNDYFNVISTIGDFDMIQEFQIFNRWGTKVYDNETIDQGWDGTYKGKPAPSDVYIFRIVFERPSGVVEEKTGDVTLIR